MLEELGHTAIAATSGRIALDVLRKEDSIDLVITDEVMPGMTGHAGHDLICYDQVDGIFFAQHVERYSARGRSNSGMTELFKHGDGVGQNQRLVILCVDDDPLVLTNTVAMLEDLGH